MASATVYTPRNTSWTDVSLVSCVAFVLHETELLTAHACQGMSHLFQIWYCEDGSQVQKRWFKRFASDFQRFRGLSCFARRVWNDLIRVQCLLHSIMSTHCNAIGEYWRTNAPKTFLQPETWFYVKHVARTSNDPKAPVKGQARMPTHFTGPALETKTGSVEVSVEKLRWQSHSDLDTLVSLFGEAVCYGLRKRRPGVKDPPSFLRLNVSINIIAGCHDTCPNQTSRTTEAGIDTSYCATDSTLRIACRFRKLHFGEGVEPPCKRLKNLILRRDPHIDLENFDAVELNLPLPSLESEGVIVELGDEFLLNGDDVEVISIDNNGVTVIKTDGTTMIIAVDDARAAIASEAD